jgi:uncharacterized protein (TIGR00725 family)
MIIAVIGDSSCSPEEAKLAESVGELLAKRGATMICGGLVGVMEAVCRGAKAKGGLTVGILPGQESSMANPWVDIPVVTGIGEARNVAVVKSAQAVIAIGGSYGTLSELAYALKSNIPVIGLNTWSLSRNGREDDSIIRVHSAAEAVDKAISLANKERRMNPIELSRDIVEKLRSTLGKHVNIEAAQHEQYLSVNASRNRKLLVWLFNKNKAFVTVAKPTKSDKGNQTSKKITTVYNETDILGAVEEIAKVYREKNLP